MKMARWMAVLFSVAVLSLSFGCKGGGGGGAFFLPPSSLAKGTFVKTPSSVNTAPGPIATTANPYYHAQNLFTANTISASGEVTSVSVQYGNDVASAVTCTGVTIKLGHTNLTALSTTYANNVGTGQGSAVTVLADKLVTFPSGSTGKWVTINFDTPFAYNGADNLVVDFERTAACTGDVYINYEGTTNDQLLYTWTPSATGATQTYQHNMKLNFAGGDDAVEFGGTAGNMFPFNTGPGGQHVQLLYLASEITGTGPITGLGMQIDTLTTAASFTYTVKLGHTTVSALTTTYADNFNAGSPTTVADTVAFTVPVNVPAGSYVWIPLTGSFTYNGSDNLIVDIDVQAGTGTTWWRRGITTAGKRIYGDTGSATAAGTDDRAYHTAFRFNGGTMNVMTDGSVNSYILPVGSSSQYIAQILYDSALLGTGGTISKLAFRLGNDSQAFDHTDVNLVLGQTSLSSLGGASLAANIESNRTTVFHGTISIPAGMKAGDWVTVPFQHSFTYDPTKNLVVQWDAPDFATTNDAIGSANDPAGRFAGHVSGNVGDRTSDVGTAPGHFVLDMQLTVSK